MICFSFISIKMKKFDVTVYKVEVRKNNGQGLCQLVRLSVYSPCKDRRKNNFAEKQNCIGNVL